jgi:PTH1 family peptidyl-tRNA hydrolase
MIRIVCGPRKSGPEYEATRHNAGFWWIDALARDLKAHPFRERAYHGLVARTQVGGKPLWLLEPQNFPEPLGQVGRGARALLQIEPQEILVAHDELDVVPGQAKLKLGGSHAGHNGLRHPCPTRHGRLLRACAWASATRA